MEFGFLAPVASGLLSCGYLIFDNIVDLNALTLLDESWIMPSLFSPELLYGLIN